MTQSDFGALDPVTTGGTELATDLKNWRDALHTTHGGSGRPSYVQSGMIWLKTVSSVKWELYLYDGSTDVLIARINPTNHTIEANLGAEGTLASASTADLGSLLQTFINVTGTTAITDFGTGASLFRAVRFSGALTLTHDATKLILLGGVSRTTAAGDVGMYRSDGSGNWREIAYFPAAAPMQAQAETTIASASTCDIGASAGDRVVISGTTGITSFGTKANQRRFVRFSGALTLTHNATSLILPGGVNRVTAANDCGIYQSDGSGNWREIMYRRASNTIDNPVYDWTPAPASGSGVSFTGAVGKYTVKGNEVTAYFRFQVNSTADGTTALFGGLPFDVLSGINPPGPCQTDTGYGVIAKAFSGTKTFEIREANNTSHSWAGYSTATFTGQITYFI